MTPRAVIRALKTDGWFEVRTKGSHPHFRHPTKPGIVTVAVHPGRDIDLRDIKSIERQSGLKLRR